MSSITPVQSASVQPPQVQRPTGGADRDNDGTKPTQPAPVTYQPQLSRPTATMGNHVNTTA